jgi:plasmid stabilization system protein ParE
MVKLKVVWDLKARNSLRKQLEHIKKDSPQAAEQIREDIFELIENLTKHPEIYPVDKFKFENTGNWRAFEKHNLRVTYYVTDSQIRILRVKHVKQDPQYY